MIKLVQIVLGTFFGDCGKGSTVLWLATKDSLVVRFSGGPQCGHRTIYNGVEHVCSLVGSGILKGAATYLHKDVYVDPISLYNEIQVLHSKGIHPTIYIHPDCRVITPYDVAYDRNNDKVLQDGTCGCGIHATFIRSKKHPITIANALAAPYEVLKGFRPRLTEFDAAFVNSCFKLDSLVTIKSDVYNCYEHVIFEGSQGLLLDMDNGFMPHCTPSKVGLNGIPEGLLEDAEVYLVMRSYLTRHGNGYEPKNEEELLQTYTIPEEPTNLDTGYQGKFKVGLFDLDLLQDAINRSHLDNYERMFNVKFNAVVTHMDCAPRPNTLVVRDAGGIFGEMPLDKVFQLYFIERLIHFNNVYIGTSPNSDIRLVKSYK